MYYLRQSTAEKILANPDSLFKENVFNRLKGVDEQEDMLSLVLYFPKRAEFAFDDLEELLSAGNN